MLTLYLIALTLLIIIFILFFAFSISKKNSLSLLFALHCLFSAIYIIGVGGQLKSSSLEQAIFYQKFKYFGAPFFIPMFFLFIYRLKNFKLPKFYWTFILFLVPIFIVFLVTTNEYHHLYYAKIELIQLNNYSETVITKGPLYLVGTFYNLILTSISIYMLIKIWINNRKKTKTLIILLALSLGFIVILNFLYLTKVIPVGIDLIPMGMVLLALTYGFSIFYYRIFDINEFRQYIYPELKEGIIAVNQNLDLMYYNTAAKNIFDWLDEKSLGFSLNDFTEGKIITSNAGNDFTMLVNERYYNVQTTILNNKKRFSGYIYIFRDNTEELKVKKQLEYLATYDKLTGIYNQYTVLTQIEDWYQKALISQENLYIIMIDLDNFKQINDTYGHLKGNDILKEVASIISEECNKVRSKFGKFGGDEFLIALKNLNDKEVEQFVVNLNSKIKNIKSNNDLNVKVDASIGYSKLNLNNPTSFKELIHEADINMYKRKKENRNK